MSKPHELPRLVVITDWNLERAALLDRLAEILSLGKQVAVQHRHPGAPVRQFLEEARALAELCARGGNALFVNGRLDVALLCGAHLHLPSSGAAPAEVRPHMKGKWVSVSVHDETEALAATGADFALVAPVFSPGSKPTDTRTPLGLDGFRRVSRALACPAYALGGMDERSVAEIGQVSGVAAISGVLRADDPTAAARGILARLSER